MKKNLSIYIHLPYCDIKCPFCNLNAWAEKGFDENLYIKSLEKEYESVTATMPNMGSGYVIETVFIGGGTPSLFSPESIGRILKATAEKCETAEDAEISIEAHPLSCGFEKTSGYREAGVNRISIGAQSFSSAKLETLGREHGAESCFEAVENAKAAGFQNISIDIIAGAPGETPEMFENDIKNCGSTAVTHISVYGLEIERGTRFYSLFKSGGISFPSQDESARMIETAENRLREYGMERYEISSFAAKKNRCRHNINYWRLGDYIGLGAGAHSHMTTAEAPFGIRWKNPRNPSEYMKKTMRGVIAKHEPVDPETGFSDSVMMGLRLSEGMDVRSAERKFGVCVNSGSLSKLETGGFISRENGVTKMTEKGFLVANRIVLEITSGAKTDL